MNNNVVFLVRFEMVALCCKLDWICHERSLEPVRRNNDHGYGDVVIHCRSSCLVKFENVSNTYCYDWSTNEAFYCCFESDCLIPGLVPVAKCRPISNPKRRSPS